MKLKGRTALVTGASRGIGRAIAVALAEEGADVAVNYMASEAAAQDVAQHISKMGRRAILARADVSDYPDTFRMAQNVLAEFGRLDILVNNAGIIVRGASVTSVAIGDWDRVLGIDLTGVFLVSRFALMEMVRVKRGGSIVNVSSVSGILGDANLAPYNAAKGGVNLLTKNMALDYASHGVRVNAVCPGRIATPMPRSRLRPGEDWDAVLAQWGRNIPLGRVGRPEDVAHAILFLASGEAEWITGATLVVDGGSTVSHLPVG